LGEVAPTLSLLVLFPSLSCFLSNKSINQSKKKTQVFYNNMARFSTKKTGREPIPKPKTPKTRTPASNSYLCLCKTKRIRCSSKRTSERALALKMKKKITHTQTGMLFPTQKLIEGRKIRIGWKNKKKNVN
jgi:hypothetical protein